MDFLPIKSSGQKVYAGFWNRFCAAWIDLFILMPVNFLFIWLEGFDRTLAIVTIILLNALYGLYNVYFNARFGGTVGKLAANIRITKPDGTRIGWGEAWKRSSVEIVFAVLFTTVEVWGLLHVDPAKHASLEWLERSYLREEHYPEWFGAVFILQQIWVWGELFVLLFNKRKRAIHDFIAGTVVIKKNFASQPVSLAINRTSVVTFIFACVIISGIGVFYNVGQLIEDSEEQFRKVKEEHSLRIDKLEQEDRASPPIVQTKQEPVGQKIYSIACEVCHGQEGEGEFGLFPPLANNATILTDSPEYPIRVILHGLDGPLEVAGKKYNQLCPSWEALGDSKIAEVISMIRQNADWHDGRTASEVTREEVVEIRKDKRGRAYVHKLRSQIITPKVD